MKLRVTAAARARRWGCTVASGLNRPSILVHRSTTNDAAPPVTSCHKRSSDVVEGEQFVDEAEVAGVVVRTTHRIEALDRGRRRIVYRLEASGPAAEELGRAISADFDDTLRALIDRAGR